MAAPVLRLAGRVVSPPGGRGRLNVLIYHRVLPEPDPLRPGDVTASEFRGQMAALEKCFSVLPFREALGRLEAYDWICFSSPRAVDAAVSDHL